MKFVCSQSDLNTHLSLASRAVPSRPTKPVLGNVLLIADQDSQRVMLTGFDESLGIQTSFLAQVEQAGRLTLPAKLLSDIVSRLPSEDLVLEEAEDEIVMTLTCSSGHYQVRGMGAEDYPNLPEVEAGQTAQLSAEILLEGLRGALFAASTDETKQVLTGVHLLSEAAALEFAATDGHRLAVVQTPEQQTDAADSETAIEVTVPGKALRELERILQMQQSSEAIALKFDPAQVIFELGQQRITTRLLEGQYPNYQQLIPRQFSRQITLDRKLFVSALERIAVLADQKNNIVKLSLDTEQQAIALTVEAQEVGSGRENLAAQITGESLDVAFNVRYLLDGLKVFNTSEVQLQCNSATSPVVLSPLGGSKMTYLVMPVQIRS
ncbi:MAG: DNA polymerase III subunit beta [Leptolyngbyaceae cyanobacterium SL_1_1]|nr:DNA polymerase III subunit beta [Leptolyngbyaceae cyanobacterium RM2_2_21]NJN03918.1 DNA polymerase III subunit beta [Leptolyngbyaceae cyanobacterium RM1_1_2]NJO11702.1 DNA polymerase III subunit beta [Leptolyngbyaceae cyanobacterium SL_1_1]